MDTFAFIILLLGALIAGAAAIVWLIGHLGWLVIPCVMMLFGGYVLSRD